MSENFDAEEHERAFEATRNMDVGALESWLVAVVHSLLERGWPTQRIADKVAEAEADHVAGLEDEAGLS
jgi:hypothetical protein